MGIVAITLWLGLNPAQEPAEAAVPPDHAAVWDGGAVRLDEFSRFLGRMFRGKLLGQEALQHLLQIQLVEREAEARGVRVSEAQVDELLAEARRQTAESGWELDEVLAQRSMSLAEFRKLLHDSLLHELMVRSDLGLSDDDEVPQEALVAWTEERISDLLAKAQEAPEGYAIDAPPYRVTEQELGDAIRMAIGPARLMEHLEQLVLEKHTARWARQQGLILTDDVLQAEIEWRRRRVAENPAFQGATYEDLLESQGSSLESVRRSGHLRAAGYLRLYAQRRFDDAWFRELSPEELAGLEAEHGEARHIAWLLLRAVPEKVDPLDLDFADAAAELRAYAAQMDDAADFYRMAGRLSEDESSRARNGVLGWVHRNEPQVEAALLEAAFSQEPGEIAEPVRTAEGMALVFVSDVRPKPGEEEFRELVRRGKHEELRREILAGIALRTIYDDRL